MKTVAYILSVIAILGLVVVPTRAGTDYDEVLTKKVGEVYFEWLKIKPGMTRAELLKFFKQETGGVLHPASKPFLFAQHDCFHHRSCAFIMVDVDFSPSGSKEARPTDVITEISRLYINAGPRE